MQMNRDNYRKNYKVDNSPDALLQHLCNMMELVANQVVSLDEAKQQADLVKQANNLFRYKLDVEKFEFKKNHE